MYLHKEIAERTCAETLNAPQLKAPGAGIGDWFVGVIKSGKQMSSDMHAGLRGDAGLMDLMNDDLHLSDLKLTI